MKIRTVIAIATVLGIIVAMPCHVAALNAHAASQGDLEVDYHTNILPISRDATGWIALMTKVADTIGTQQDLDITISHDQLQGGDVVRPLSTVGRANIPRGRLAGEYDAVIINRYAGTEPGSIRKFPVTNRRFEYDLQGILSVPSTET